MSDDRESVTAPLVVLWSKHRVEALTDGIFAVAMTLLVIDLKVPDPHAIHTQAELAQALADVFPKAMSWLLSFFVLATFWIGHHRLYHYVRYVDRGMLWRNLYQLAFVSLMPFSAALLGEFGTMPAAQIAYNGNMIVLGLLALRKIRISDSTRNSRTIRWNAGRIMRRWSASADSSRPGPWRWCWRYGSRRATQHSPTSR